jgi:hypothetical protein
MPASPHRTQLGAHLAERGWSGPRFVREFTTTAQALGTAQRFAFRHLDGPADPDQARDLYFLAAATSGMIARAALDAGSPDAAMTATRTALLCADRAGHSGIRLWIRNQQASAARWAGWHREALRIAQLGDPDAESARSMAAVAHASHQARAFAATGDEGSALDALSTATDLRERARPDELDDLGGRLATTEGAALYLVADTRSFLPDSASAEAAADTAISALIAENGPDSMSGNLHGAYQLLALARARSDDPDGVREALRSTLALPSQNRAYGILVGMRRVRDVLTEPRYRGVRMVHDLTGELEAFDQDASSTPALPL